MKIRIKKTNKPEGALRATPPIHATLLLTILTGTLTSCTPIRYITVEKNTETKTETIEIIRDTTIYIPSDQATAKALLECDSTGKILIKQIETLQGKLNAKANIRITGNTIIADCLCDSMKIYMQLKDRYQTTTTNTSETTVQWMEKELKWWQRCLIWMGAISILMIILSLIFMILKIKK